MGTHGRIEKAKQASGTPAGLSQPELALGSPNSYCAQEIAQEITSLSGDAKIEVGRIELASIEASQLRPRADGNKSPAQDCEPADETAPDSAGDSVPKGVNRFTLLAACLALAAAVGGMVGTLAAYSLARPAAPVQVATSAIASE